MGVALFQKAASGFDNAFISAGQGAQQAFWSASNAVRRADQSLSKLFDKAVSHIPSLQKFPLFMAGLGLVDPTNPEWVMMTTASALAASFSATDKGQDLIKKAFACGAVYAVTNLIGEGYYMASGIEHKNWSQILAASSAAAAVPFALMPWDKPLAWLPDHKFTKNAQELGRQQIMMSFIFTAGALYISVGLGIEDFVNDLENNPDLWDVYMQDYFDLLETVTGGLISISAGLKLFEKSKSASWVYFASGLTLLGATIIDNQLGGKGMDSYKAIAGALFALAGLSMLPMKPKNPKKAKDHQAEHAENPQPMPEPAI